MQVEFSKYHGTGNDFVLIDNRNNIVSPENMALIRNLCDRRFGIGADGLMLLENETPYDFRMRYFNADGKEASMCGNGGRCIAAFAHRLGIIGNSAKFIAIDGEHEASVKKIDNNITVKLKMTNVSGIERGEDYYFLNTGSPHFVKFIPDVSNLDIYTEGRKIRFNERFAKEGTNVNFVSVSSNEITVRTYERGVEDETLSCGTGVVASAISASFKTGNSRFKINAKGGTLEVDFKKINLEQFEDIWLTGPATHVFDGVFVR